MALELAPHLCRELAVDVLTAAWQRAVLGPEMLEGTLPALDRTQGTEDVAWAPLR